MPEGVRRVRLRILILVPSFDTGGGIPAAAQFAYNVIARSGLFDVDLVSLSTSARDPCSVRLLSPSSWARGVVVEHRQSRGIHFRHVGAVFSELEFQRYRSRPALEKIMSAYDMVQVIAGSPAWGVAAASFSGPRILQVATLASVERRALLRSLGPLLFAWRGLMTVITAAFDRAGLRDASAIQVMNSWMLRHAASIAPHTPVVLAPPGVDTEFFRPPTVRTPAHLLTVARLNDPRKNIALLVRAYARLRGSLPGGSIPPLVLAGKSRPPAEVDGLIKSLRLEEVVIVQEAVSEHELLQLYQHARLFVCSSDEEGLGIAILEAMACGAPVVSTRCGGPETMIRNNETGLLVDPNDEKELADAMARILIDEYGAARMAANGLALVQAEFSYPAAGARLLSMYQQLAGTAR